MVANANKIQIKRSTANGVVSGLANGELAFTQASNTLWIGLPDGSGVVSIAGERTPGTLTANQALVANSTSGIDKVIVANLVSTAIYANGSHGNAGQVLVSNGSSVFWGTGTSGSNTQIQFNDSGVSNGSAGFTFVKTSNNLTVGNTVTATYFSGNGASITSVNAATVGGNSASDLRTYADDKAANAYSNATSYADLKAANAYSNATSYADNKAANAYSNATSYADNKAANAYSNATSYADNKAANAYSNATSYAGYAASNAYSNAMSDTLTRSGTYTGVNIFQGNTNFQGQIANSFIPTANLTYTLGNTSYIWANAFIDGINGNTANFTGDVTVGRNLIVGGNVTTQNVQSIIVSDPLIFLAGNNTSSDMLDIGFAGQYYDGGNERWTGFYRDHADSGIYKLFTNTLQNLLSNNDIDPTYSGYQTATLQTYLLSGGLVANSSNVQITANSTYGVSIVANTLTLTTPLNANSGGTGQSSYTAGDLLYANGTYSVAKLGVGANGELLQIVNNLPAYGSLDGGTF